MLTGEADNSLTLNWSPPLFTHHENPVPTQDNQATHSSEPILQTQDNRNSLPSHHTVTRSRRVIRPPDYYGVSGNS